MASGTVWPVRIATWNVNSLKQRMPRLLPWLDQRRPDVVCLQETKLADDALAELLGDELSSRGYEVAVHGETRVERRRDPVPGRPGGRGRRASPGRRGSRTPRRAPWPPPAAASACTPCTCRTAASRTPTTTGTSSPGWRALRDVVAAGPEAAVVCGDMNIAPTDADVFDPDAYVGQTHVTPPERAALAALQAVGLHDVVRDRWPDRARVHLLGLPGRDVPPGPGHADRPDPGRRPGGRARARRRGSTARRARARGRATTRR